LVSSVAVPGKKRCIPPPTNHQINLFTADGSKNQPNKGNRTFRGSFIGSATFDQKSFAKRQFVDRMAWRVEFAVS